MDTKQSPYRILFQREVNTTCLQIAVGETEASINAAWVWIEHNIIPEVDSIDDPFEKERWVIEKISMIVTAIDTGTDDLSTDEKVRSASRTFRQLFDVPPSERLVSYYSCSLNGRQGWLYISENFLGFYSFLLSVETKKLIELKNIKDITKENSKRNMFADSLRITTKDKEEQYFFSNMFKRDEVYDLLVQLTGQAMIRLLRNAGGDAPGSSTTASPSSDGDRTSIRSHEHSATGSPLINPLKHDLAEQKRNTDLCLQFRLPLTERLLMDGLRVGYTKSEGSKTTESRYFPGHLYLTETFLCFESVNRQAPPQQHQPLCSFVLPLYTIKRVERLNTGSYATSLSVTTWHDMEHIFQLCIRRYRKSSAQC
ncbi:hypothetical protein BX666DRAFT_1925576 [Dichotomocladium elegans]|nr:hypothetical protein BX666DRAFT_1925576 [Dichotomocladium elegans]